MTGTGAYAGKAFFKRGNRAEIKQCPWFVASRRFRRLQKTAKTFEKTLKNGDFCLKNL